jgi:hypothetical protein
MARGPNITGDTVEVALACTACGRPAAPYDFASDEDGIVRAICAGCHGLIFEYRHEVELRQRGDLS